MPSIIHVDDDEAVLDLNEFVLAHVPSHVDVMGAANAQEALDAIRRADDPVLLVVDHWMPDMTGVQLWQTCKDLYPDRAMRAVVLTGSLDDELESTIHRIGATMVWKQIGLDEYRSALLQAVDDWLADTPDARKGLA